MRIKRIFLRQQLSTIKDNFEISSAKVLHIFRITNYFTDHYTTQFTTDRTRYITHYITRRIGVKTSKIRQSYRMMRKKLRKICIYDKKSLSTSVLPMGPTEDTSARLCSYTSLLPKNQINLIIMPKFLRMSNFFSIFARFFISESAVGYRIFV